MATLPPAYHLLRARAQAWLLCGQPLRALALLDAQVRRWPDASRPLASRAHLLAALGQAAAALRDSRRLVTLRPARAADWFNLGFLLEQQAPSAASLEEALAAFGQAVALDPALDRAWYGQGLVLARLGRLDEAADALRRTTELQPMSPGGWEQLARVHLRRQAPGEAQRIIAHLRGFEPAVAARLAQEAAMAAPAATAMAR